MGNVLSGRTIFSYELIAKRITFELWTWTFLQHFIYAKLYYIFNIFPNTAEVCTAQFRNQLRRRSDDWSCY